MKSRVKASKRMVRELEQQVFDNTCEACEDNNAMFIFAIAEEYGFSTKRLKRVIERFNVIADEYTKLIEDGYTHDDVHVKIVERLNELGFAEDTIYSGRSDFYAAELNSKRIKKKTTTVSFAEASEAQKALKMMKELQNAKGNLIVI